LELPLPDADPVARFDDVESKATRLPSADTDVLLDPTAAAGAPPPLLLLLPQLGTITAVARSNPHVAQAGRCPFRFVLIVILLCNRIRETSPAPDSDACEQIFSDPAGREFPAAIPRSSTPPPNVSRCPLEPPPRSPL
jgi:hypothetical protein